MVANQLPPADLRALIQLMQQPTSQWGISNINDIPPESALLSPFGGISDTARDFIHIYDSPEESQAKEVRHILMYCRESIPQMNEVYKNIRTFLTQNAVLSADKLYSFALQYPKQLSVHILNCYVEFSDKIDHYRKCSRCGWTLSYINDQWICGSHNLCGHIQSRTNDPEIWTSEERLFRLTEGVHRYTLLPGLAELTIKDKLERNGYVVELYPNIDQYDLAVKIKHRTIYLDVKDFSHPLYLANFFNQMQDSQLSKYYTGEKIFIVVPEYRNLLHPRYVYQVQQALNDRSKSLFIINERSVISKLKEILI